MTLILFHYRSPEILENIEAEERRLWEEEQERMRQERGNDSPHINRYIQCTLVYGAVLTGQEVLRFCRIKKLEEKW